MTDSVRDSSIAIIGMSCRFPGASSPEDFWSLLAEGREGIRRFTPQELLDAGITKAESNARGYVPVCGPLEDVKDFDAAFFGFSPREAAVMDPQQRLFLETAWHAIERAGYDPFRYDAPIGLFAGTGWNHYLLRHLARAQPEDLSDVLQHRIRNDKDFLTTLASYKMNLQGPSLSVQTACSTSLVAVHLACQSLRDYECDIALAGGININVPEKHGYPSLDSVFSSDGHCRAFDARADGTVPGSGVGLVVLKRLPDALEDGDAIDGVIRSTAINNDGHLKAGYTAPSVAGQTEVIATAQALAGVEPETVTYVEAHGTATPMGDPIEVEALTQAFRMGTSRTQFCGLGSVKSNIGHLDAAAGVASLIKTALALKHGQIPPTLHFDTPNPRIDFANSPFYVNDALREWPDGPTPRRAGVSAFGVGGTNAHVVLEEAPETVSSTPSQTDQLIVLSAKTEDALEEMTDDLADFLSAVSGDGSPSATLDDVAFTLWSGRRRFEHRRAVVASDFTDAAATMRRRDPSRVQTLQSDRDDEPVVFLYPGLGNQHANMGRGLYRTEPVFRTALDNCAAQFKPLIGINLVDLLYPNGPWKTDDEPAKDSKVDFKALVRGQNGHSSRSEEKIHQTRYAQPIIFSIEYALSQLWKAWGIEPIASLGHSLGEYVSACNNSVFSLSDACRLVATRASAISEIETGAMLAVSLPEAEVRALLNDDVYVSAINTPAATTVAGTPEAVAILHERLKHESIPVRQIQTTHAFHTPLMRPAVSAVQEAARQSRLSSPRGSYISNVTGTWIRDDEATDPEYWARHMCEPVRFSDGVETLMKRTQAIMLEVGPGQTLGAWVRQNPAITHEPTLHISASLPHERDATSDRSFILKNLGRLWAAGAPCTTAGLFEDHDLHRVSLPTYPFQRRTYDLTASSPVPSDTASRPSVQESAVTVPQARKRRPSSDRFEVPVWTQLPPSVGTPDLNSDTQRWLVFLPQTSSPALVRTLDTLRRSNVSTVVVRPSDSLSVSHEDGDATCRPGSYEDYLTLLRSLRSKDQFPTHILYADLSEKVMGPRDDNSPFFDPLHLIQAIGDTVEENPLRVTIMSRGAVAVLDSDQIIPRNAMGIGPCQVAMQEIPALQTRFIDLGSDDAMYRSDRLLADVVDDAAPFLIAYRGKNRWSRDFRRISLPDTDSSVSPIRRNGVYLIVGGLGAIGRTLSRAIATSAADPVIILTGRRPRPVGSGARVLHSLEDTGATVIYQQVDVTDADAMRSLITDLWDQYVRLDGVVHAAGVVPGGLISVKNDEDAEAVLAPKVAGTRALVEALQEINDVKLLDFVIFASSLHAIGGGVGTVDHTAANAFQDSYAHYIGDRTGLPATSINWAGWSEIGQAADAKYSHRLREAFNSSPSSTDNSLVSHPLLTGRTEKKGKLLYHVRLHADDHWMVDEHRLNGSGVLPGTGTLDLIYAAIVDATAEETQALANVHFLKPLRVSDAPLHACLEMQQSEQQLTGDDRQAVSLWVKDEKDVAVTAQRVRPAPRPPAQDLEQLRQRCSRERLRIQAPAETTTLQLGPRWRDLDYTLHLGEGEAFSDLSLDTAHKADVETHALHPALLDIATGLLQALHDDVFLPLSYGRIDIYAPLPARVFSHLRVTSAPDVTDALTCDVMLMDEEGHVVVSITDYTIRRLSSTAQDNTAFPESDLDARRTSEPDPTSPDDEDPAATLTPEEGADAFLRLLTAGVGPRGIGAQVAISPMSVQQFVDDIASFHSEAIVDRLNQAPSPQHERPDLGTPYVAPRTSFESSIADIWSTTLGIESIGVHDNFFELGGDSLLATRMIERIGETLHVDPTLRMVFDAPTVAQMTKYVVALQIEGIEDGELDTLLDDLSEDA